MQNLFCGLMLAFALSCSTSTIMKSESSGSKRPSLTSHDLVLVEKDNFSIRVPNSCKEIMQSGDNGSLWQFRDDEVTVDIELGMYAPSAKVAQEHSNTTKSVIEVDGTHREVVHFNMAREAGLLTEPEKAFFTLVSFEDPDNPFYNFSIRIAHRQEEGKVLALRIIESLKFKGELELRGRRKN